MLPHRGREDTEVARRQRTSGARDESSWTSVPPAVKYANDLALAAGKSLTPSPVFDFRYKFGSDGLALVSTQFSQGEYG